MVIDSAVLKCTMFSEYFEKVAGEVPSGCNLSVVCVARDIILKLMVSRSSLKKELSHCVIKLSHVKICLHVESL